MKYKGLIFDLDGVICHTDIYHYEAWKAIADRLGIYFDKSINDRLRGVSRAQSLDIILERWNGEPISETEKHNLMTEKNELYREFLKKMSASDVSNDVLSTLRKLRERGIKLAIGSASKNAGFIISRIGLDGFFDAISDGNNIEFSKPHPQVFTMAAEYLGLQAKDCLVVEDAKAGIEAAVKGGFDSAGIGDAAGDERATYKINKVGDLLSIVNL